MLARAQIEPQIGWLAHKLSTMSRSQLLALLFGLLLVASPVIRGEDEYEDDGEEEAAAPSGDDAEKDVLVLTEKNFDETLKKYKYVLVGARSTAQKQHAIWTPGRPVADPNSFLPLFNCRLSSTVRILWQGTGRWGLHEGWPRAVLGT